MTEKEENFVFIKGYYFPLHFRILAVAFIAIGLFLIASSPLVGVFLIPIAILFFVLKEHSIINLKNGMYSEGITLLGLHLYRWKSLPDLEYVSIFPTKLGQNVYSARTTQGSNLQYLHLRLNLIYNRNKKAHCFTARTAEEARKVAMYLGDKLEIGVYDCSPADNVWLKDK